MNSNLNLKGTGLITGVTLDKYPHSPVCTWDTGMMEGFSQMTPSNHSTLESRLLEMVPDEGVDVSNPLPSFKAYPKTQRLENETITISEKIDGTNGALYIHKARFGDVLNGTDASYILAGSRSKWLLPDGSKTWDNHGFGTWVKENEDELMKLPEGFHYGEWYGKGINHGYGMKDRKFMLFNLHRYIHLDDLPKCVELETVIRDHVEIESLPGVISELKDLSERKGSWHIPGQDMVEGLILRFKLSAKVYKEVWHKS